MPKHHHQSHQSHQSQHSYHPYNSRHSTTPSTSVPTTTAALTAGTTSTATESTSTAANMNPWEVNALQHNLSYYAGNDPVIYPGLYAPNAPQGLDIMTLIASVVARPSPQIDLGPVDMSCAILVCDIEQPDYPIVYVNPACTELTGYSEAEMVGRNCRFMQEPGGRVAKSSARSHIDRNTLRTIRRGVEKNKEIRVELTNFKKNGQPFQNVITMIPVCWHSTTFKYYIGFMVERTW